MNTMLASDITIAVVIVNYNAGNYIGNCLTKLQQQRYLPTRVIVIDNASSDGSNIDLAQYYPSVEVVQLETNKGFAAANNIAFEMINDCQWVALLNPDTLPDDDWLAELAQATIDNPNVDSFASKQIQMSNPKQLDGTGDMYHVSGLVWRRHFLSIDDDQLDFSKPIFGPCAASGLYRLAKIKQLGGFDEDYFCYCEDIDLAFRLRLIGCDSRYIASAKVLHEGQATSGKNSDFAVYHGHRNLVWCYFKNMPTSLLWRYLPQHILVNLLVILRYLLDGRLGVISKSKWDALRGLGKAIKKRKQVQQQRTVSTAELQKVMVSRFQQIYNHRYRD